MKCKIFKDESQIAEFVGKRWIDYQKECTNRLFFVSSSLSKTIIPIYQWIIENADSFENWNNFRFVLMDEQLEKNRGISYISVNDSASYERFAREKFLNPLKNFLGNSKKILLKPNLGYLKEFDGTIKKHSGIDLLILAIGAKGHYAQVIPKTPLKTGFHITILTKEFIENHTKKGGSYEGSKFRKFGMSLGPIQVLQSKKIFVIITGKSKKRIAKQLFSYNSFDPNFPISIIFHPKIKNKTEVIISKDVID